MFLVIGLVTLVAVVMLLSIILNDDVKDNQIILVNEEWNDVGIKSGHFFLDFAFQNWKENSLHQATTQPPLVQLLSGFQTSWITLWGLWDC